MLLTITYTEIQDLIKQKVQKDIRLSPIDSRTICVATDITVPLLGKKEIKVLLRLEELNKDYILLSYNNGFGVDLAITGILKFIEMSSGIPFVQGLPNNRIQVHLHKIAQIKSAIDAIVLQDLSFSDNNAILGFKMRN